MRANKVTIDVSFDFLDRGSTVRGNLSMADNVTVSTIRSYSSSTHR
jgi:hypothetical protein